MIPLQGCSISTWAAKNDHIYRKQNDRHYDLLKICARIFINAARISTEKRRSCDKTRIGHHMAMTFSWICALANKLHTVLEYEIIKRFPEVCPYCRQRPCLGGERCKGQHSAVVAGLGSVGTTTRPSSLPDFQTMLARIYPNNTLPEASERIFEEIGEVTEAVEHFVGRNDESSFKKIIIRPLA